MWMDKWMGNIPSLGNSHNLSLYGCNYIDQSTISQIDKDLRRTQPQSKTFQNETFLARLKETLIFYHLSDPEVGYMQGMNIVASVPVYHSKSSY